ncbi:molybdenum cofactor biosynthesis protein MoaE [Undibacterium cyanobacteriorum]|uniref:Molybdopterin synthase catalytic subunit n=1 Tax=Undibacterium cyanobacteriorum TaxID=3073561 RepID=A0ABY9RFU8_9BURK|nr:molybdenum cofactor biosynthesis protein MoaE [Undibacterium sp. 20NA77.5]WMW79500.1 molybdenum cofactor biosynthesis protein MoaE [Undibacterium sp. 20NA77.5]
MEVRVQREDFDLNVELHRIRQKRSDIGAVVSFVGLVRDMNDGQQVAGMELEHYPGMTEKSLNAIALEAQTRWNLFDGLIIHRVGPLLPRDQIVLVVAASAHRGEAFAACEFMMDYLKTQAPFWKKESTPEGERWVDARVSDDHAMAKWTLDSKDHKI